MHVIVGIRNAHIAGLVSYYTSSFQSVRQMSEFQLPPLKDQKRFEYLVLDLFNAENDGKMYKLYGRDSEDQEGIDILSDDSEIVIQCKKKDVVFRDHSNVVSQIRDDLRDSTKRAKGLHGKMNFKKFILASTYKQSKNLTDYCQELKNKQQYSFVIQYLSWDEVESMILKHDWVLKKYYPNFFRINNEENKYFNVPLFDDDKLIPRDEALKDLSSALNKKRILIVSGLGGQGKTTIVNQFANDSKYSAVYDHILWVTVNNDLMRDFTAQLTGDELGLSYDITKNSQNNFNSYLVKLGKLKGKNLLIIDGADNLDDLKKVRSKFLTVQWDVIITSRVKPAGYKLFTIEPMSLEESLRLFKMYYCNNDLDEERLEKLLLKVEYNPLLIELLSKTLLDHPKLSLVKLISVLDSQGFNSKEFDLIINTNHALQLDAGDKKVSSYVYSVFNISTLDSVERRILLFFSVIPHVFLDPDELHNMFMLKRSILKNLIQHLLSSSFVGLSFQSIINIFSSILSAPRFLRFLFQVRNLEVFINKLNYLSEIGWLRREAGLFSVHPTVQFVIWSKYRPNSKDCALLIKYFIDVLKTDLSESRLEKQKYLLTIDSLLQNIRGLDVEYSTLINEFSVILDALGESEKALKYQFQGLEIVKNIFSGGPSLDENTATFYNNIGRFYMGLGKHKEAIEYSLKAKEIREYLPSIPKSRMASLAETYLNLTDSYRELNDFDSGLQYGLKSLNLNLKLFSKHSIPVANSYHNLSFVYEGLKDFQGYLDCLFKSNSILEKELDSEHPDLIISRTAVAGAYYKLKDLNNAKNFIDKAMELRERVIRLSKDDYQNTLDMKKLIYSSLNQN